MKIINKKIISFKQNVIIKNNQNRLLTPYNLFYTLKYIAQGFKGYYKDSIFNTIPVERKCKNSNIKYKCNCK